MHTVLLHEFPTVKESKSTSVSGKAPGADTIPAEIYKAGRETDRVVSLHVKEEDYLIKNSKMRP